MRVTSSLRLLGARTVANYSGTPGECSPDRETARRAVQMRVHDNPRRRARPKLLIGHFCAQARDENPAIPGTLGQMLGTACGHDRVQDPRCPDVPGHPRTEPPKAGTDRQG